MVPLDEELRRAREALLKLENYWLKKMNNALRDQRKYVQELEQIRLRQSGK